MSSIRLRHLLGLLKTDEWSTAQQLAVQIGRSEKTVRTYIHELNGMLEGHGARIVSQPRCGYRLHVDDKDAFDAYLAKSALAGGSAPQSARERTDYLIVGMLYLMDYVKAQDLCNVFYISGSTLSSCLRAAEEIYAQYDLKLDRRPNHGMRVIGDETNMRRLIAERYVREQIYPAELGHDARTFLARLVRTARGLLAEYDLPLTEFSFESLMDYCVVARSRVLAGFTLKLENDDIPEVDGRVHEVAGRLLDAMDLTDALCGERVLSDERRYLELYLEGSRIASFGGRNGSNFVINERCDRLTVEILRLLTDECGINLLDNFDLRMQLNQHLAPMAIRLRYGIRAHNLLLGEIKRNYPLACQMAIIAGEVLRRHFGGESIPEDELGYIAIILQLGLERGRLIKKHDVLIVSDLGRSSSALLRSRLEQCLGSHIGKIYLCDRFGLETYDFSKVDFVFTTFPIMVPVPKPVLQIGPFLDDVDAHRVEDMLRGDVTLDVVDAFVGPERFLTDVFATTREGVLEEMCRRICAHESVDEDFTELVFAREKVIQVSLGTGVALPHPYGIASDATFAYVAVLPCPVEWHNDSIRVAILVSMGRTDEGDDRRRVLNETLARFAFDAKAIGHLAQNPTYEMFRTLLGS